jgi:hypothetical protein
MRTANRDRERAATRDDNDAIAAAAFIALLNY